MKANEDIPDNTAILAVGPRAANTLNAFGDLRGSFVEWWERGGAEAFREQQVPKIRIDADQYHDDLGNRHEFLSINLPLGISRKLIHAQIDVLLDHFHENAEFKRHKASTAPLKINPRHRSRSVNYQQILDLWKMKQVDLSNETNRPLWELNYIASNKRNIPIDKMLRGVSEDQKIEYGKRCYELLVIAEEMMQNALTGSFPNYSEARAKKAAKSERGSKKKNAVATDE